MHGFFVDMRLYRKVKSIVEPFSLNTFKQQKIKEKIAEERTSRIQIKKLPQVNREFAAKLMEEAQSVSEKESLGKNVKAGKVVTANLLQDPRFKNLFENPEFQINKNADEFRLLKPLVSKLDQNREKQLKKRLVEKQFEPIDDSAGPTNPLLDGEFSDGETSGRKRSYESESESSSDDEALRMEQKKQYKLIGEEKMKEKRLAKAKSHQKAPRFMALKPGQKFNAFPSASDPPKKKLAKASLEERLHLEEDVVKEKLAPSSGSRQMTFSLKPNERIERAKEDAKQHHEERRKLIRPAGHLRTRGRGRGRGRM